MPSVYDKIHVVNQPSGMKIQLFKHQLASIYKMEELEYSQVIHAHEYIKETKIGINGDLTGYGKTYTMLGLIIRNKMPWNLDVPFIQETINVESGGLVKNRYIKRYNKLPTTLILVSPSIVGQWEEELNNTSINFKIIINKKDVDSVRVEDLDVVLVTISMYNNLVQSYSSYAWKRFIFDEPGHTRVPGMKTVQAGFIWFVTATPHAIISKHFSCRNSMMKTIVGENDSIDQFNDIIIKNDANFVKESFAMPETKHYYHKCFQPIFKTINGLVNPVIDQMLEAGYIEGVINALGGTKTDNIITLIRNKKTRELSIIDDKLQYYTNKNNVPKLEEYTNKKQTIIRQLNNLDKRFNDMLNEPCIICYQKLRNPVLEPLCQTLYCGECLLQWLKTNSTCPCCRETISPKNLIYVSNTTEQTDNNFSYIDKPCTKLEKIIDIINRNKQGKFIIYSSYDETFKPICQILEDNQTSYVTLKGTAANRQLALEQYKNQDIKVIFLNSNFNSAGINLQETTDIILYHKMLTSTQTQIIGRAERIGRKGILNIHHLNVDI
tara:strand:+ start:451 stop:2103 length:1653 start_codon:yes stop_codon:yes gene_type:complete